MLRGAVAVGLALVTPLLAPAAPAQEAGPGSSGPEPAATSGPAARRDRPARTRRTPVRDAIERAVDEVMKKHEDPCAYANRQGVPCFPTGIEVEGPRFSVAEAMRRYRADRARAANAPITAAEMRGQMSGAPQSASGGVSFDPVCTTKSLIRRVTGQPNTYYLYRLSDGRQERPLLTDRRLDPRVTAENPEVRYEFLGEFSGECEAVAAWRKELREAVAPPPVEEAPPPPPPAPASPPPLEDEITVEDSRPPS
jgi:hypothetical protein